ncbi:MAG: hypothetical protein NT001_02335 [Candidatus Woesearchaeota archaeon]|nr:hypothetical protein [Candidatus Woesearchaeota archaeon]
MGDSKPDKAKKELIEEKIGRGYIRFSAIIEMMGAPKEYISKTFRDYIEKLRENRNIIILKEHFAKPKKKDTLFVMYVELELLAKDASELVFFCFDYMPSSIEIIEPEHFNYRAADFAAFLNDMQARMHTIDSHLKNLKAKTANLERNAGLLLRNNILIVLKEKDRNLDELAKGTGIPAVQLSPFLEKLIIEGWIKKAKDKYSRRK